MRGLDRLQVHQSLQAGVEHHAGALADQDADSGHYPTGIILDMLVLATDHKCRHHLTGDNQKTAKNC